MRSQKHAEELSKYAKGWTIVEVEDSDRNECWWKLTLRKGGRTRTLHLFASLGAHVEDVRDQNGKHLKFDSMVESMTDHVCSMQDEHGLEVEQVSFTTFDNSKTLEIGFRCPITGKEFVSHISAAKESTYAKRLTTPEERQKFAEDVWNMNGIW